MPATPPARGGGSPSGAEQPCSRRGEENPISDNAIRSDYITAFYREGDTLLDGRIVGFRRAGVRLAGDVELTGYPEELANVGQALVDRFRTEQYVLVTGTLSSGFTFHGPTAAGEDAAEEKILDLHAENWDFHTLTPLTGTPATSESSARPAAFADLITRFLTAAATVMAARDEEAAEPHDTADETRSTNSEAEARQQASDSARDAVGLAYRIITGEHLDAVSEASEAVTLRHRVAGAMSATLNIWQSQFASALHGIVTALTGGELTEQALADYPGDHHSLRSSHAIARAAGLAYATEEAAYDGGGLRIDVTAEHVGAAIDALRAIPAGDADIENGTWSFHEDMLTLHGLSIGQVHEVMRTHTTVTEAAHLVLAAFAVPR
ncbi:hypothetical protein [Actinoplanes sp. NPDC049118]|uniref:hypothetical protein n=1 Tax=Actinoplanes sp. NPDC049118 TaxID=3155769 RepID=UPI0033F9207F